MDHEALERFSREYAEAWSGPDASRVASFYAEDGSLTVNGGEPIVGRAALTGFVQAFMTAFPVRTLDFDGLEHVGDRVHFRWTFRGRNTGPGGTGHSVRFSGVEKWNFGPDDLVADCLGAYDADEYQRQVEHGIADDTVDVK